MKVHALEFRVADKYFAIEMKKVHHFFEVENILKLDFLPDFVLGIVKYNNHIYPLISLKKAWNLEDNETSQTAVAIILENKEFAILIDEIIKIEELEKKENFSLEVFEEEGKLIGNLNLDFLQNIDIPTFHNKIQKITTKKLTNKESFLLFKCNEEIIGIDTSLIKKVEDYEKEMIILNNMVLNITPFDKLYKKCEYSDILVLEKEKTIAIPIGNIIDIYLADKDDITVSNEDVFNKYFLYNSQEVKIFSNTYLENIIEKYGVHIKKEKTKKFDEKIEVLVLNICGEKFAIRMKNVIDITEYDESSLNYSNHIPHVKGIIITKEGATYILSFENILNKKPTISEDSKIIVLKNEGHLRAILVDNIEDIIYVKNENIILSDEDLDNIIGGMVIHENKMIPLINIHWPKDI